MRVCPLGRNGNQRPFIGMLPFVLGPSTHAGQTLLGDLQRRGHGDGFFLFDPAKHRGESLDHLPLHGRQNPCRFALYEGELKAEFEPRMEEQQAVNFADGVHSLVRIVGVEAV